ncbi:MAG: T9SS type A sorting domain-containing protein, partial [Chitinophagales bacterium]
ESQDLSKGYRMASVTYNHKALWIGGSAVSYNYNGIAYNGSGGVPPLGRIVTYDPSDGELSENADAILPIMDLRGIAQIASNQFIIVGGMVKNQEVTNQTLLITDVNFTSIEAPPSSLSFNIFPNPTSDFFSIEGLEMRAFPVEVFDLKGQKVLAKELVKGERIAVENLQSGIYWVRIEGNGKVGFERLVVLK